MRWEADTLPLEPQQGGRFPLDMEINEGGEEIDYAAKSVPFGDGGGGGGTEEDEEEFEYDGEAGYGGFYSQEDGSEGGGWGGGGGGRYWEMRGHGGIGASNDDRFTNLEDQERQQEDGDQQGSGSLPMGYGFELQGGAEVGGRNVDHVGSTTASTTMDALSILQSGEFSDTGSAGTWTDAETEELHYHHYVGRGFDHLTAYG